MNGVSLRWFALGFNPRTHAGCDDQRSRYRSSPVMFQSTHPRRVRLQGACQGFNASIVSIHAPTQGATTSPNGRRRSTQRQSTHPRRVRPSLRRALPLRPWRFNPRTHAGCDLRVSRFFMPSRVFQSTHPRRVRRSAAAIPCSICCFNPRTHAGCDISSGGSRIARAVSIHAPTQGATPAGRPAGTRASGFNPRTHAGCDQLDVWVASQRIEFQSTHPRRVRLRRPAGLPGRGCRFNPRTHAGCDATALRSLP